MSIAPRGDHDPRRPISGGVPAFAAVLATCLFLTLAAGCGKPAPVQFEAGTGLSSVPGTQYLNQRIDSGPWSIHIVRIDRTNQAFSLHSAHADGRALGLNPLSQVLRTLPKSLGEPVAAVNGDFYQRDRAYAGDPRGVQIIEGDLISAPIGGVGLWVDAQGGFHSAAISNQFRVTWPDGRSEPFALNEERRPDRLTLYTPAVGDSTRTAGGREWIIQPVAPAKASPFAADTEITVRVVEARTDGNSPLRPETLVLSAVPALAKRLPETSVGTELRLATTTLPALRGARSAISGGPTLVHGGKPARIQAPKTDSYEFSSMFERHPRTAVGWNDTHLFLVQVDGRQKGSVGMTLEELGDYLARLGCTEAMNLDGGGSATLWYDGRVRNDPCDGRERPIANGLVVLRAPAVAGASTP